jgi:hypothetical protein
MSRTYPYTLAVDKLKAFMSKLQQVGKPSKVDWPYVRSLGYKSSNHKSFPSVLRYVGLIDAAGRPTPEWTALREGKRGQAKMATYIKKAYQDLYEVYPNAHLQDTKTLADFFRARTEVGDRAIQGIVGTFQALCSFALFEPVGAREEAAAVAEEPEEEATPYRSRPGAGALTINVNIHLDLPSTTDPDVYEALFSSMARHIPQLGKE